MDIRGLFRKHENKERQGLSQESGIEELNRLFEFYRYTPPGVEDEDGAVKTDEEKAEKKIVEDLLKDVMNGYIYFEFPEDDCFVIQVLKSGKEIRYATLEGKHKKAMRDKNSNYSKLYEFLGSLSGLGEKAIEKLKGADLVTAEKISAFFLLL